MAIKKSQLYSSLWQSCDELRGGMDASQYKDYVLTLLFMKYVSDRNAGRKDALIEVPEGGGFADMARLKGDKEIGEKINKIISRFAEANDLKGVVDQADFNDDAKLGAGKEMQDRLARLIGIFEGLDFSANRADGDDLLGDAYEYLMRNFATESGKSKGQFYTPAEVSRIMARVIGIGGASRLKEPTVYDPTCGSGSLLIKAANESGSRKIAIYGQEMDNATWSLARMNMILHGHATAEIWRGNTIAAPHFKDKSGGLHRFDFAVANPPFSTKAWANGIKPEADEFRRFEYGVPPEKNGDYAFLLHLVSSLNSTGKGAIILPHGVLFRGGKEADIRKRLVEQGLVQGIIGLPANLFFGTGIPACVIVIDKENAAARKGVFIVDASKGFLKDGNKNRLREQDIHKIVDVFTKRVELPRYSRLVPLSEIASDANDYNLNIPRYIDSSEPEDLQDLDGHLRGGIPNRDIDALGGYWAVFPTLRKSLFKKGGRPGYSEARLDGAEVKRTILGHEEFTAYADSVRATFARWRKQWEPALRSIGRGDIPRVLIRAMAEDLLERYAETPIIDPYDLYQRLMDYWERTMQDDLYLLVSDGWKEAAQPRVVLEEKDARIKETPDLSIGRKKYKMDLLPPALVSRAFFPDDEAALDALRATAEAASGALEEFIEENSGDEGLLADAQSDKGKVTKATVRAALKSLGSSDDLAETREALQECERLIDEESSASKALKAAEAALDEKVLARYARLSEQEIKDIVVASKWLASLEEAVEAELGRVGSSLAGRVKELEDRYAEPLASLERSVQELSKKVSAHLARMGLEA